MYGHSAENMVYQYHKKTVLQVANLTFFKEDNLKIHFLQFSNSCSDSSSKHITEQRYKKQLEGLQSSTLTDSNTECLAKGNPLSSQWLLDFCFVCSHGSKDNVVLCSELKDNLKAFSHQPNFLFLRAVSFREGKKKTTESTTSDLASFTDFLMSPTRVHHC